MQWNIVDEECLAEDIRVPCLDMMRYNWNMNSSQIVLDVEWKAVEMVEEEEEEEEVLLSRLVLIISWLLEMNK